MEAPVRRVAPGLTHRIGAPQRPDRMTGCTGDKEADEQNNDNPQITVSLSGDKASALGRLALMCGSERLYSLFASLQARQ